MDKEKTIVVFRRWPAREGGDVLALFPAVEHCWPYCSSYQHVGQHGGADYRACIAATKPARISDNDVLDLWNELENIGYNLEVRRRYVKRMEDQ